MRDEILERAEIRLTDHENLSRDVRTAEMCALRSHVRDVRTCAHIPLTRELGGVRDEISERAEIRLTDLENLSRDVHTSLSPVSRDVRTCAHISLTRDPGGVRDEISERAEMR